MKLSRIRTLLVFFSTLLLSSALYAQFETAEVLGTVHDPSGQAVSNASVTLLNQGTGIEAKTTTDDSGDYDFPNVKVGKYTVTVEAPGFSKVSAADIDVAVEARQRVDLSLQVGEVSQSVNVTDVASILDTDTSEHSQVIGTQQVVDLPLNGRQYSELALLATNVHLSPIGGFLRPNGTPREGAFNVNGMRSTYNNFLLDGLDNNSYGTSNQNYSSQVVQPSPDAIAEFRVITSNFSAEYGRVGGGVVNAALRSGTNHFHGTLYEFLRNTDLNAIGYVFGAPTIFVKPTAAPQSVRRHHRRPDHQKQALLLRRLRRLPPDLRAISTSYSLPDVDRTQRNPALRRDEPVHRRLLSGRHADSGFADQSLRRGGARRPGGAQQRQRRQSSPTTWRKPFR